MKKSVSVIILVLNEEKTIEKTRLSVARGKHRKIIVVNCGSRDHTRHWQSPWG